MHFDGLLLAAEIPSSEDVIEKKANQNPIPINDKNVDTPLNITKNI